MKLERYGARFLRCFRATTEGNQKEAHGFPKCTHPTSTHSPVASRHLRWARIVPRCASHRRWTKASVRARRHEGTIPTYAYTSQNKKPETRRAESVLNAGSLQGR